MSTHQTETRQPNQRLITSLPNELFLEIFKCVAPKDLLQHVSFVCRRWRALALDPTVWQNQSIRDNDIRDNLKILHSAPLFKKIKLTAQSPFDPNSVYAALTSGRKNIKCLSVHFNDNCFNVTQICGLLCRFQNLTELDIQIPASTQDKEFCLILGSLKTLQSLTLTGVLTDTQAFVDAVVSNESLKKLDLSECRVVLHDHHLCTLFCEHAWYSLRLVTHFITEDGYAVVRSCPSLRDLALIKCRNLSQMALDPLATLPELRALAIKENCVLSATALTNFFNNDTMVRLVKVDLTVYRTDDDVALTIATHCANLMHLRIAMCLLTDKGVRDIVLNAANLTHLDLEFNNIRGDALHLIPKYLPNLAYLNLHLCYNVHINLLVLAQSLPNFTVVDPTGFHISSSDFSLDTVPTIYT